ncbi:putative uncharacterized protein [Pseudomonas sp. StFLB209]|nr:putative uncharacterized protein [Pseudomonas sp. StFLB209]
MGACGERGQDLLVDGGQLEAADIIGHKVLVANLYTEHGFSLHSQVAQKCSIGAERLAHVVAEGGCRIGVWFMRIPVIYSCGIRLSLMMRSARTVRGM